MQSECLRQEGSVNFKGVYFLQIGVALKRNIDTINIEKKTKKGLENNKL